MQNRFPEFTTCNQCSETFTRDSANVILNTKDPSSNRCKTLSSVLCAHFPKAISQLIITFDTLPFSISFHGVEFGKEQTNEKMLADISTWYDLLLEYNIHASRCASLDFPKENPRDFIYFSGELIMQQYVTIKKCIHFLWSPQNIYESVLDRKKNREIYMKSEKFQSYLLDVEIWKQNKRLKV